MYINPFIAGIIVTLTAETLIVISTLTLIAVKEYRRAQKNEIKRVSRKIPK